jgi:acyl carrier protein
MCDGAVIVSAVRAAVARIVAVDENRLRLDADLYAELGADSLAVMELLCELEDRLGIDLPESTEFALGLRTVGDVVAAFETCAD